jgi:hypothetical protein
MHGDACLVELVARVAIAIDQYRAGEVDARGIDETIRQYHPATGDLWKLCPAGDGGAHMAAPEPSLSLAPSPARGSAARSRGVPRVDRAADMGLRVRPARKALKNASMTVRHAHRGDVVDMSRALERFGSYNA